jgi:hypothetical protein
VHGLHRMYHRLGNRFCPIELLGDVGHLESRWKIGVMVCTKRTIHSEIILDTLDGTPRLQRTTRSLFRSVWR